MLFHLENMMQFIQEPFIDIGHSPYFVHTVTSMERSGDGENSLVGRIHQLVVDVFDVCVLESLW